MAKKPHQVLLTFPIKGTCEDKVWFLSHYQSKEEAVNSTGKFFFLSEHKQFLSGRWKPCIPESIDSASIPATFSRGSSPEWMRILPVHSSAVRATWPQGEQRPRPPGVCRSEGHKMSFPLLQKQLKEGKIKKKKIKMPPRSESSGRSRDSSMNGY